MQEAEDGRWELPLTFGTGSIFFDEQGCETSSCGVEGFYARMCLISNDNLPSRGDTDI